MAYFTQSEYGKFVQLQNVSGSEDPATGPEGGVYLFASGTMDNAKLYMQNEGGVVTDVMKTLDIDAFTAKGDASLHQTQDHFVFSDNGTEKKITFSNLQDAVFADVSGDATIAAGGALTIAAQAVENSMLADDAVGADELAANAVVNASIASNAAIDMDKLDGGSLAASLSDLAQGDLLYAGDVDASNAIKSITFSNLEDAIFGNVSGDATIAAGGALTIAAQAVENSMLADDAVGADELAANAVVEASIVDNAVTLAKMAGITRGSLILGDSSGDPSLLAKGTAAQFLQSDGTDPSYVSISGDATVAAGGALTIANDAVEQAMIADDAVGADQLASNAVVNASIASNAAIDMDKLDGGSLAAALTDLAQGDLLYAGDADASNAIKSITFSNLEDAIFGNVSGDATIAAGGALTIAAQAVENSMLADDAVGADELAANAVVNASVASNAAIALNKIDGNVDMGGDFVLGNQANDTCLITGLLKLGADTLVDSGNNAAISLDGSAGFSTMGGYGGGSGISFSAASGAQLASNLTVNKSNGSTAFDATFFGDTAGAYLMWDGGEDRVKIHNGTAQVLEMGNTAAGYAIDVPTGTANVNKIRAAAFVTYSDENLKSDVATMNTALDTVMSLNGVEFTWKDSGERDFGFIAQDVQSVLPKAVHTADDGVQGVDYSRLTSVLVEAVKAQQVQIEELKAILKK
jgi:hypothetical protein